MSNAAAIGTGKARSGVHDPGKAWVAEAIEAGDFRDYQRAIIHDWLRTLTAMAVALVPLFFLLDIFTMPSSLLPRFALYRLVSTIVAAAQAIVVRSTRPGKWSFLHGYLMSLQVGGMIALMTVDLGGFDSSYYAGLTLVIIGVNFLMPWRAVHTAINVTLILALYICLNLALPAPYHVAQIANNLFFLSSTALLAVTINHVRYKLIQNDFSLLLELKRARDSLWSEMELAKRLQTALLPKSADLDGYSISVAMLPAKDVGGDYYDIIQTEQGERWIAIGDVAGHGVDSGLIMMIAQTSLMTVLRGIKGIEPVEALELLNKVLKEDISRLGTQHYMTMMILRLGEDRLVAAGHHQDLLVYRAATGKADSYSTKGTWLGISEDIAPFTELLELSLAPRDAILLFTDGVTEGENSLGEMFGQARLLESFERNAALPSDAALERILLDVRSFQDVQEDDITLMILQKAPTGEERKRLP
jgi:serine phosphatase RsbU (regulator of sigma subunit)